MKHADEDETPKDTAEFRDEVLTWHLRRPSVSSSSSPHLYINSGKILTKFLTNMNFLEKLMYFF